MPFLVLASLMRSAFDPVVFCIDPSVKNCINGPLALAIDVRIGDSTSSACLTVGAVVDCWVVDVFTFKKKDGMDMEEFILDMIDFDVDEDYEEDEEEGTITIYGDPKSYAAIQKHLEECGFEDVGGDFTYIPNDLKDIEPEHRETINKMIERLEEFDDVQTVYTNMKPEEE